MEKQLFNIRNETSELIDSVSLGNNYKQKFSFGKKMGNVKGLFKDKRIVYSIPFVLFLTALYITKPGVIMKKDKDEQLKVDMGKLIPITLILTLIVDICIKFFYFKN